MPTYRKPRKPQGFKDGGAVPIEDHVPELVLEPHEPDLATARFSPASSAPADAPIPAPEPRDDDAVARAIEGHRRAEELQRQAEQLQRQQQEAPPDPLAGYSPFWRENIRAHPYLLDPSNGPVVVYYLHRGIKAGINPESPAMLDAILDGLRREAGMTERAQEIAAPRDDAEVLREAEAFQAKMNAAPVPPKPRIPEVAKMAPSRNVPVSAPVNREAHSYGGQRSSMIDKKLSPAEVEIARKSFTATDMTDDQKIYLYWQNREKLRRMRETGEYRRTTEQSG